MQIMIADTRLATLFTKYIEGYSSPEETYEFMTLVNDPENEPAFKRLMDSYIEDTDFTNGLHIAEQEKVLKHILQHYTVLNGVVIDNELKRGILKRIVPFWKKMMSAAAVLVILSIPAFLYVNYYHKKSATYSHYNGEIAAGSNKAVLTLSDGTKLVLNNAKNGELAKQHGVKISKTADGKLLYELIANSSSKAGLHYNTIATPAGGQYQVVLPDGTKVWLNALSSLTYPTSFVSLVSRKVLLTGEAYFEVAKAGPANHRLPFIVSSKGQEVEVLGTHFNVNCYPEELASATTLLEGSVAVSKDGIYKEILKPGQQALVNTGIKVKEIDTSAAIAWKNGLFKFENASITTVMHQFSRWYDVDVEYEGTKPENRFNGELYRNTNAGNALQILKLAKIKFSIEATANKSDRKKIIIRGEK